jgi:hypothetical protein
VVDHLSESFTVIDSYMRGTQVLMESRSRRWRRDINLACIDRRHEYKSLVYRSTR